MNEVMKTILHRRAIRRFWQRQVAENMMLAADSLGVGSCYIGQGWTAFADPYGQEILRQWNIRPDYYAVMQLLLGYPCPTDGHPAPKRRKEGRILRF